LKNDSFISKGLKELEKLSLNRFGLEAMEIGAFNGLTNLTCLSVRHNKLHEIIPRTFEKNNLLKYLDLSHNKIEHLEIYIFCGLVKKKLYKFERKQTAVPPPRHVLRVTESQNTIFVREL